MTTKKENGNCKNYHHGDLRNTLIIAAAELIEENGSLDFAMIDAARRAGVSSAAPYRHFKDKDALLEAVTEVSFLAMTESTQRVVEQHKPGSEKCIIALAKAYVAFVTGHPEFYDLMWGDMGLRGPDPHDPNLKNTGFHILVDTVQIWCENVDAANHNALELAVKLWAMAHGLACLAMNKQIEKFMPDVDVDSLLESSALTFLEGIRQESRSG
jgi:AcrR family transcriptional regulator